MRLDGNAAAGALQEILRLEVTSLELICSSCATEQELGSSMAYVDAPGIVLRCVGCESVLLRVARSDKRVWFELCAQVCWDAGRESS